MRLQERRSQKKKKIGPSTILHAQKHVATNNRVQQKTLKEIYAKLYKVFGPQNWWPAETKFEVIVGAILTQNTNWVNVEKALQNLKSKKYCTPQAIHRMSASKLSLLIKPAGYFNVKAKRIKNFVSFLFNHYQGSLEMSRESDQALRKNLLLVNGIGPEIADSILLYVFDRPVFVVDAYTKRILYRHNLVTREDDYHAIQKIFTDSLESDVSLFNEYHALIVRLGKDHCKPKPQCEQCLLNNVHYSIRAKCTSCHRAFLKGEHRVVTKNRLFCGICNGITNT